MKVVKINEVKKESIRSPLFTGSDVTRQVLLPNSKEFNVNVVTSGKGIIATETEQKVISAGEVVIIPAGEKHWHGATENSVFSHIFVSRLGSRVTQLEK